MYAFMYLYPENLPAGSMPKTKGVPYSWEISQPDGNDEGTDISKYSSLGAPADCREWENHESRIPPT